LDGGSAMRSLGGSFLCGGDEARAGSEAGTRCVRDGAWNSGAPLSRTAEPPGQDGGSPGGAPLGRTAEPP